MVTDDDDDDDDDDAKACSNEMLTFLAVLSMSACGV